MLQGVHLTLMIGPLVPVPAPQVVMDAFVSAKVTSGKDKSGFQLTFAVSKRSPLLTTMLPAGYFDPMVTRVILIATMGGFPNVIMDGIVTNQEFTPSSDPGQSTLTITGSDLSVLMDVIEVIRPYPAMNDTAQVSLVLASYLAFGITPIVIPSIFSIFISPTQRIESQTATDLQYIRGLADRNGYVFYVDPGPLPGQSIAYFGPDIRIPVPQPALSINMDAETNVESLSFSLDGLAKEILIATLMDPFTEKVVIALPLPNVSVFQPPLGLRPTPPAKVRFTKNIASMEPEEAVQTLVGRLIKGANAITASGTLDVLRYGHVLRSRLLVGVRGAGLAYDGLYYVDSVTHDIKRGEYKQSFQLSRDGLISNTPKVPV